ncbi:hypothetical protein MKEN_00077300 [Mycena kentingensis (nom. inval.)]|nr:hypothetical protein MKEN_00077300 [Mycena kentingensis (nom. inval.)]
MMTPETFKSSSISFAQESEWQWTESSHSPGFLQRAVSHTRRVPVTDNDDSDPATASTPAETLTSNQYIVFSPTFRVPTFYFTLRDASGSPLMLDDLVNTTLFHRCALDDTERTSFAATQPGAAFPLLSQGEHPVLGTPCWFLHPCESAKAVEEIMRELGSEEDMDWFRSWMLVLCTVVAL